MLQTGSVGGTGITDAAPSRRAACSMTSRDVIFTLMDGYLCSPSRAMEKQPSPSSRPASHENSQVEVHACWSMHSEAIASPVNGLGSSVVGRPRVVALYQWLK